MAPYRCDYLDQHKLPQASSFINERTELAHINGQIRSLDQHMSQMTTLRQTLLLRSHQLHNSLLPAHSLPFEIMSDVFKQIVDRPCGGDCYHPRDQYHRCSLRQALVLASVSPHFRNVAVGTPELWRRVELEIPDIHAIYKASSLLQRCIALSPSLDISVTQAPIRDVARSAFDTLFAPEITQKIKSFHINESDYPTTFWIDKLKACSPILDTLNIQSHKRKLSSFDVRPFTTLTRLTIRSTFRADHSITTSPYSITVPPSVQYLVIEGVIPNSVVVSLLYQCPNLVECDVNTHSDRQYPDTRFTQPLTLPYLKKLSSCQNYIFMTSSSLQHLRLPSLECLQLQFFALESDFLCQHVSATLTTLSIDMCSRENSDVYGHGRLSHLSEILLPALKTLDIYPLSLKSIFKPLEALETQPHNFPALQSIILHLHTRMEPRTQLNEIKSSKIGKTLPYDFKLDNEFFSYYSWPPGLLQELRSTVNQRRVEVTRAGDNIHE